MRGNSVVKCGNIRKFKTTFYALFPSKSCNPFIKIAYFHTETYRSGRNELDSKSSCPKGHVGSNPTHSARKSLKALGFQGLPLFLNQFSDIPRAQNGAHGALFVVPKH